MQTFIRARFYSYMFGKIRFISLRQIWTSNREDGWERNDSFHVGWGIMIIFLTPASAAETKLLDWSWDNLWRVRGTTESGMTPFTWDEVSWSFSWLQLVGLRQSYSTQVGTICDKFPEPTQSQAETKITFVESWTNSHTYTNLIILSENG